MTVLCTLGCSGGATACGSWVHHCRDVSSGGKGGSMWLLVFCAVVLWTCWPKMLQKFFNADWCTVGKVLWYVFCAWVRAVMRSLAACMSELSCTCVDKVVYLA